MGRKQSTSFLSRDQARDLRTLGERARQGLSDFAGQEVGYDVEAMQLLDEWIDDTLERASDPPGRTRLAWISLVGEMFRRRHEGWWARRDGELVIVCPTSRGEQHVIHVQEEVERRITFGMSESLTYSYNITRIELKMG